MRNLLSKAAKYRAEARRRKLWQRVVSLLVCVVVFVTTYAQILPAIALEEDLFEPDGHVHTDECYKIVKTEEKTELDCPLELHTHTAACYDADGALACGYADFVVHTHDSNCYDENGKLVCTLPEIEEHTHTALCYSVRVDGPADGTDSTGVAHVHTDECYTETPGALLCGEEETDGHTHTEDCYVETEQLVCELEESEGHTHTDLCMDTEGLPELCGLEESEGHTHDESCYETVRELVCEQEEAEPHHHTEDCYASAEKELTCGFEESESEEKSEGTEETPDPFDGEDKDPQPICGQEEIELHTHTAACFGAGGAVVCGQLEVLEHQHTEGCFRVVQEASEEKVLDCAYTGSADKADEERPADSSTAGKDEEKPADSGATGGEDGGKEDGTTAPSDPDDEPVLTPATLAERVLAAAESYIGYKEDAEDCDIDADGETRGLTQFGLHYGMPYEKWDAMFVAYCLEEAGVEELPSAADCLFDIDVWASMLDGAGYCQTAELYTPAPGDVAFFDLDGDGTLDHVAFVEKVTDARLFVIAGDSNDCVRRASYARADESVVGYGVLPRDEDEPQDSPADEPDEDEGAADDVLTGGPSEDETEDDPAASDPMDGPQDDGDNKTGKDDPDKAGEGDKTDEEDKKDEDADQDSTQEAAQGLAGRVLAAAQAEFGYTSAPDGTTLYRTFYDDPTAPLDVLFVAYCLDQAGIEGVPSAQDSGFDSEQWRAALAEAGMFRAAGAEEAAPAPGEVLFLDKDGDGAADFVAIVEKVAGGKVHVLEMAEAPAVAVAALALDTDEENGGETTASAAASCVRRVAYSLTDTQVLGYTALASLEDEDTALTEEEQAQVDEVIAMIDALPTQEEIEETLTALEDDEDEDGYDAYLAEVVTQAKAAYEAYEALSEAQQEKVTNAARLMALEPLWSAETLEIKEKLTDDSAYVSGIAVTSIADGTGPFDNDDSVGNDSSAANKIVRTFDTVTYEFEVMMASYNTSNTYREARVKLEFVLPLTADQATFDQGAMAWMDQASGYAPALTTETRTINGVETQCQVLTCYKHLLPSEGHSSVVPGSFGENVTVNVKSMKNDDTFAPMFSAAMEYGTWNGECPTHNQTEKATVTADRITVSAAPKYNIRIGGSASYKTTFDFSTGNETAKAYGAGYFTENSQVTGRVIKYGIVVQLYNDNASKGLKGIELPDGSDITFDLNVSSQFTINMPNTGSSYTQGSKVDTTSEYTPLLWSCDGNIWTSAGETNSDGRVLYDSHGCAQTWAPYASRGGANACYNSGTWTATQDGSTIHVTVSGYQIDVDQMPTTNGDTTTGNTGAYGVELGIGCFSAGELWLVQPYNRIGGSSNNQGPNFDVVTEYGQGKFDTNVQVVNMKAITISGSKFEDPEGTSNAQTKTNDDAYSLGVELTLPGGLQNRVAYANPTNYNFGVGVDDYRNGLDFATPGTEIRLLGGFSYNHRNEEENTLYWGTNLTKFYGSAIEITTDTEPNMILSGGADAKDFTVLYATKKDGTDWASDNELLHTYEDSLVFYKSPSEIPSGHLCVGLLFCFKEDTFSMSIGEPYFFIQQPAKVRDNMDLSGKSYMLASTSRVWTKAMFEQKGMTLDNIPDWTNSDTKLSSFPAGYYKSANIEGSTWYVKTDYSKVAETGAVTDHNSDWRHWGDTLLVIGYKTGITKNLVQKGDGNTDKNTYNLDAEQRVVDFKLQPRTYYDQGSGNHSLTTTVTIVDTLPKYLTYRAGSAYFGGTYTQTSVNGGTQGTITGGELQEPNVTKNPDGTQTLTWVITNVTVGEDMPAIYYSADIGNRNNPNEDVPTGTTNLVNQVRISATHDIRQPSLANGNYAEAGIAVTRGSASSFGKYSKQKLVEPDGVIDYVVYFDNNSASSADVVLMDTMPYNGISGSHFNGTYTVNSWKLDVTKCDVNKLSLYYTMDIKYKDETTASLGGNAAAKTTIQGWMQAAIASDGTVTDLNGKRPVAWAILGTLENNKRIQVDMQVQLQPDQSTTGNEIQNNYYVNAVSSGETTIHTETPTVNRTLEGLTWMDDNADGIQNENTGRRISGVKVELLKLKENGDSTKESDYEPYHYQGDPTKPVVQIETGQIVSVRAESSIAATDYEQGRYKFTDLPAGTFAVRFTDGNKKISPLIASPDNRGTDDTLDSDGIATYSSDHSRLEKTVILGIELPTAENMSVTLYESKYHDSGFYEKGYELPNTGGPGTTPYTIGGTLLLAGAGLLLVYSRKKRRREDFASS